MVNLLSLPFATQVGSAKQRLRSLALGVPLTVLLFTAGCGGGDGAGNGASDRASALSQPATVLPVVTGSGVPSSPPAPDAGASPVRSTLAALPQAAPAFNGGVADPGLLMLLVPDGQSAADPRLTGWLDAASEIGARMAMVTDAQFLAMGTAGALQYAGLVLPDQLHSVATDDLVTAVRNYTTAGGRTLLTFDFAALTLNGNGQPVYPIPKSRLSDLAGVDYILYDSLLDRTVGLGPVTAMRSTMRELQVPPGKSMPYGNAPAAKSASLAPATDAPATGALGAAKLASNQALYLPVSPSDPGGVRGFDSQQFQNVPQSTAAERSRAGKGPARPRTAHVNFGKAFKAQRVSGASRAKPGSTKDSGSGGAAPLAAAVAPAAATDTLDAYSGYVFGHLIYPSYVTSGTYTGVTVAASPDFGLVAGISQVGTGRVLFVNLPLTYLKGQTDALPMHGFLHYFMQQLVQRTRLSSMPNAVAGMALDWHLDSMEAQAPTLALEQAGIFNTRNFSMEMTAGPDTVVPGDGLGWNLDNNPVAQRILRRMDARGHAIGSHGGWIHDYWVNATEDNRTQFLPYLEMNKASVDAVIGRPMRSYSAPVGNNPTWAMDWLEQQGVVGAYFGGHTGLGVTRQYRDGILRNPALWVFPVTPEGLYATFEDFQEFNVPKQEVIDWYRALVDFNVAQRTNRLIYMHPPGADLWRDVLTDLLTYASGKGAANFRWYTMPRLADFMMARHQVSWSETLLANGATRFTASHPVSLAEMVWMVPKARYLKPVMAATGMANVADGGTVWLVKAQPLTQIQFQARPNPTYVAP